MLTEKIRRLLGSLRNENGVRAKTTRSYKTADQATFIVAERMTPLGCECSVVLANRPGNSSSVERPNRHRRLCIPGVAPGSIIRTYPRHFDMIAKHARLPPLDHCTLFRRSLMRTTTGKRYSPKLNPLPCSQAAATHCNRCPWMAVADGLSGDLKAEALRESFCRIGDSLIGVTCSYLEPFSVTAQTNRMQEVTFVYVSGDVPGETAGSLAPVECEVEWGSQVGFDVDNRSHRGYFCFSRDPKQAQSCLLCTLEQKRLLTGLTRWSRRLSLPMQRSLGEVYVSQPSHCRSEQAWHSDLHVTLCVKKDLINWGPQSPLCSPSHPDAMLSMEEQGLVDSVLDSAALVKQIEVDVLYDDGAIDILYPRIDRHVECPATTRTESAYPTRTVSSWCGLLEKEITTRLPALHSRLLYQAYIHSECQYGSLSERGIHSDGLMASGGRLSFWRHHQSLDAATSLLSCVLLESCGEREPVSLAMYHPDYRGGSTPLQPPKLCMSDGVSDALGGALLLDRVMHAILDEVHGQLATRVQPVRHVFASPHSLNKCSDSVPDSDALTDSTGTRPTSYRVLAMITNAEVDGSRLSEFLRHKAEVAKSGVVCARLLLVECRADLSFAPLLSVIQRLHGDGVRFREVRAGVIDVDPMAASAVGYCVIDLTE